MKVLLDENLPHRLRHHLPGHEAVTIVYAGWAGIKNGELLKLAEAAGFEVLVTGGQNIVYQQRMTGRRLAIVELSAQDWPALSKRLVEINEAIHRVTPGSYHIVKCGEPGR